MNDKKEKRQNLLKEIAAKQKEYWKALEESQKLEEKMNSLGDEINKMNDDLFSLNFNPDEKE